VPVARNSAAICPFPWNAKALAPAKIHIVIPIKPKSADGQFSTFLTIDDFRERKAVMSENIYHFTTALDVKVFICVRCPCCQEERSDTG
jgi:hypothetical protein